MCNTDKRWIDGIRDYNMKAFLVNIDVVVRAEDEDEAKKEAMRVAPDIHKGELYTDKTKIVYINEVPVCPNCGEVNIKERFDKNVLHMAKQKHECLSCKMVF